jgi:hypothetical protein
VYKTTPRLQPGRFLFLVAQAFLPVLFSVQQIPKLNSKETFVSSLSAKDRVSLCSFTFSDGRRCRSPRNGKQSHFYFDHAQKEAQARAKQKLGDDLAYFFSGDYLSACDLSTALGRLIPAVIRGDVKPRAARTIAYMAQTLLQAIHISQHEYCEAFDDDAWRKSIRNSVNGNRDYLFPPAPKPNQPASPQPQPQPAQPQTQPPASHPAQAPVNSRSSLATHHSSLPQTPQPAPSPHTPLPPTSAEFIQHVVAGLQTGGGQAPQPAQATQPAPAQTRSPIPSQALPTLASAPQPNNPPPTASSPKPTRTMDSRALHFDHNYRLLIDGKPF